MKRVYIAAGIVVFITLIFITCKILKSNSPESQFNAFFADLSVGVPEHLTLTEFSKPSDAVKGDFCIIDMFQTASQFKDFTSHIGVSEIEAVSPRGAIVQAHSRIDPKYPWILMVHAEPTNSPAILYRVHIEGSQPYN